VTWGFARPLTWCLHNAIVAVIARNCNCSCSSHATTVSPSIWRIKHGFVRLSAVRLSHRFYKLKPITSTSDLTWHLECGRDFEVIQTTLFFGKRTTKNTEGMDPGTPDAAMHRLHICCTMRANGSFVIRRNAEFSGCRMKKVIMGNLRNVPHLIFCKLPHEGFLKAFRIPQSAFRKILTPFSSTSSSLKKWIGFAKHLRQQNCQVLSAESA